MATFEKLGIQVDLIVGADFKNKIKSVQKQLDSLNTKGLGSLAANVEKLTSGLTKAAGAANTTSNAVKKVGKSAAEAGKQTKSLGASLSGLTVHVAQIMALRAAFHTITGAVSTAVSGVIDLDQTIAEVGAISTASAEQMKGFEEAALAIGASSKFTAVEVADTMRILAQAGVQAADLAKVTKNVEFFATGTGSGAMDATKAFTTAMRVWNIEGEESVRISNVLTAAMNNSKLTTNDMSTAFNYLANQGEALGIGLEETSAIIATMTNRGMRASTVGTGMSGVLTRLAKPTARIADLMETYGLSLDEVNPQTNKFADILDKLNMAGVTTVDILGSFERRTGRALVTALGAGGEAFRTMENNITGTSAAMIAYTKVMDGARAQINVLQSELLVLVQALANDLAPRIKESMDLMRNFVAGLGTAEGKFAIIGTAVAALGLALAALSGPVLIISGLLLGLGLAVANVGKAELESTRAAEEMRKEWAETAEVLQRSAMAINDIQGAVDAANASNKDYVELTHNQKIKLTELSDTYPMLLQFIGQEKIAYDDLAESMGMVINLSKQKRIESTKAGVAEYNRIAIQEVRPEKLKEIELSKEIEEAEKRVTELQKLRSERSTQQTVDLISETKKLAKLRESLDETEKKRVKAQKKLEEQGALVKPSKGVGQLGAEISGLEKGLLFFKDTTIVDEQTRKLDESKLAQKSYYTSLVEGSKKALEAEKAELKVVSERIVANLEKARSEAPESERKAFDSKITAAKIAAIQEEINLEKEQQTKRAMYREGTSRARKLTTAEQDDYTASLTESTQRITTLGTQQIRLGTTTDGATSALKRQREEQRKLNEDIKAITAAYARMAKARENALTRTIDTQATGDDVRAVQIQDAIAQKQELESRRARLVGESTQADKKGLDVTRINTQIEDIDAALLELKHTTDSLEDTGFLSNFTAGIRESGRAAGDSNQLYKDLGVTLTDGLTGSVTGMIDALADGENAWDTFKNSLGNILQDMGKQLLAYAAKVLIVKAITSAIGGFASGGEVQAGTGDVATTTSGTESFLNNAFGIKGYAAGGAIPNNIGVAGQDSVPAMLMPGEFVIRKSSVDKYGLDTFRRMNAQHFAEGGMVGTESGKTTSLGQGDGRELTINVINVVDPESVPKTSHDEIVNVIRLDAMKKGPALKTIKMQLKA